MSFRPRNQNDYPGEDPANLFLLSPNSSAKETHFEWLTDKGRTHPLINNGTTCTFLVGTPGPNNMAFMTTSCTRKVRVTALMCLDRNDSGSELSAEGPIYTLRHLKVKFKPNDKRQCQYF